MTAADAIRAAVIRDHVTRIVIDHAIVVIGGGGDVRTSRGKAAVIEEGSREGEKGEVEEGEMKTKTKTKTKKTKKWGCCCWWWRW